MLVDPIKVLLKMPAGTMIYGRGIFEGNSNYETYFAIKEEPKYIKKLGKYPLLTIRTGLIIRSGVALVPFLMRVNEDVNMLYESWLNYHDTGGYAQKTFQDLTRQDNIPFIFYDSQGNECRKIGIKNNLKETFQEYIAQIDKLQPWSMQDFDKARNTVYAEFPSPMSLWQSFSF